MSKKKYKKGAESLKKQIDLHRTIKLRKVLDAGNLELSGYYKKEIGRLREQLREKESKIKKKK